MARNQMLIQTRNRKIAERYYYWTEIERLRFDDAIKQLAHNEFFLSETSVERIIRAMAREGTLEHAPAAPIRKHSQRPKISREQYELFTGRARKNNTKQLEIDF